MTTTSPLNANLRGTITLLTSTLRDLDLDGLPDSLTAELDAIDAAAMIPADLIPDSTQVARRWYDLHRDGKDPAADKTVRDLLARNRETTYGLELGLNKIKESARHDALTDAADGIVETLREIVRVGQDVIDEARAAIGIAITEPRATGLSPDGHRQHARAADAFRRADLAKRAWALLAQHTGRAHWRPNTVDELLILGDLTLDDLAAINDRIKMARRGSEVKAQLENRDARTIVAAGHPLDLTTFEEFRTRLATVTAQAQRERDAEARKKRPREHGGIDPVETPVRAWVDVS